MIVTETHTAEIARGERFEFGENWRRFLEHLTAERIAAAEQSLRNMLDLPDLEGRTFLDIGSGSGLFSLAARRLGARVFSFDYDPQSVACTSELRRRYFDGDPDWRVEEGSALDGNYIARLGQFDIVYSWGVLHHTGAMWKALEHASVLVRPGGLLFIALYNNQGGTSRRWNAIKRTYNRFPIFRGPLLVLSFLRLHGTPLIRGLLRGRPLQIFKTDQERGMSLWRDLVDWVGGYPFEVADPGEIFVSGTGVLITSKPGTETISIDPTLVSLHVLAPPKTSQGTCSTGQFSFDTDYYYICTAPNTWKRVALASF